MADPDSKKCLDCVKQYCFDDLVKCAGVNSSVLPPKPYIPPQGDACNNAQDLLAFNKTYKTFHGLLEGCAKKILVMHLKVAPKKILVMLIKQRSVWFLLLIILSLVLNVLVPMPIVLWFIVLRNVWQIQIQKNVWIVSSNIVSMTL
eukprot:TRINITY_DN36_c0_g1_i3.p1 TRINITY_DN36_c0_g1~~TRINITY_DN36_c0_g1_i3.p1  ORF type:complete len:146 (-),score=14.94 TRINITY_DN36_c0_g1_i3:68-505(-)